jgi:hypothetical protein
MPTSFRRCASVTSALALSVASTCWLGWRRLVPALGALLVAGVSTQVALPALQLEPRVLLSPVNDKPFDAVIIPITSGPEFMHTAPTPADMGVDPDGCRHTSEASEYDYFVITDPHSFFSALAIEWTAPREGGQGRLREPLSREFKEWIASKDGFHGEYVLKREKWHDAFRKQAQARGGRVVPLEQFTIPQDMIPLTDRYRWALTCYARRGASELFSGRLAMSAAWAIRARLNKPLMDASLKGGIEEVNVKLLRHIQDGESFELDKFYKIYGEIFTGGGLSDEGYFVAGMTFFGLSLRKGDLEESQQVLDKLFKRFEAKEKPRNEMFRILVRDYRESMNDYRGFLDLGASHFIKAIANEEVTRAHLPQTMLVVAEFLRRLGDANEPRAAGWYRAIGEMEETQPTLRAEIRALNKVPSVDAPFPVLLAWQADEQFSALAKALASRGVAVDGDAVKHPDAALLNAIVHQGLGSADYRSERWRARTDGDARACAAMLNETGLAVIEYIKRGNGTWPERLDDLWLKGYIRDRNRLNRFHCPASGKPFDYRQLNIALEQIPPNLVLLAGSAMIPHPEGQRYPLFLSDLSVVFSAQPVAPGQTYTGPRQP